MREDREDEPFPVNGGGKTLREVEYRDTVIEVHLGIKDGCWHGCFRLRKDGRQSAYFDLGLSAESRAEAAQIAVKWAQKIVDRSHSAG
jgi:hypothetical protein